MTTASTATTWPWQYIDIERDTVDGRDVGRMASWMWALRSAFLVLQPAGFAARFRYFIIPAAPMRTGIINPKPVHVHAPLPLPAHEMICSTEVAYPGGQAGTLPSRLPTPPSVLPPPQSIPPLTRRTTCTTASRRRMQAVRTAPPRRMLPGVASAASRASPP